jgi:tetratricopeptide (TPR) repeat protein
VQLIAHESTDYGWRGLTELGEVLEVRSRNGGKAQTPEGQFIVENYNGRADDCVIAEAAPPVADYLAHYNRALLLFYANKMEAALAEFDKALAIASTARVRFNRALALLGVGRWLEGFAAYEARYEFSVELPREVANVACWHGEDLHGKRLALVHDAGFGDTIMNLRYVPQLIAMGADVSLVLPPVLARLCRQCAPLNTVMPDFYCGMLSLLHRLQQTIELVPSGKYLAVDPLLVERWRKRLPASQRSRIGLAWSVGRLVPGDYPRAIEPAQLVNALAASGAELFSIQQQEADEAARLGVTAYEFEDFADCAALISLMHRIITVDTAAVHVAGAIGHPDVTVLLAQPASWRWRGNPFYPHIRTIRQETLGDWTSVLQQL